MQEISKQTARRFVLGQQGIWPGRRWQGHAGVEEAIRTIQAVQIDTISVVARNHDLTLWSRVAGYRPEWLETLLYQERRFFEYGGVLFIYPLAEWPYWQTIMSRDSRWRSRIKTELPHIIELVKTKIALDGPLASRDFKDRERVPGGFNTVKDTTHALDYLWITGELMVHSRRGFDRVYELTERLQPAALDQAGPVSMEEAEYFFAVKALRDLALATPAALARRVTNMLHRRASPTECAAWLVRMLQDGLVWQIKIEGLKDTYYYPAEAAGYLAQLENGKIPESYQTVGPDTLHEVNFLAPLDNVTWDRLRLKSLFAYDYVWEVYKPQSIRRWGYYTLPVLYGDRLVARIDPKLDRRTGKLTIQGFWLDDETLAGDDKFASALDCGLRNFARFHQATELDASVVRVVK
jgi:uncharacterized protein YcaQ